MLTTDFFTPVVDDAYTFGRIAAANALSDVYAMGGTPVVAVNLLGWPRDVLPAELAAEVLRGGLEVAQEAGCHVGGGHSIDDPEPKYGMAVTGLVDLDRLIRNDAAVAGDAAVADQAAGRRRAQQPDEGDRRGVGGGGRVDDRAQPRRRPGRASRPASGPAPTSPASACSATSTRWRGPAGSPRWSTPPPSRTWPARARRWPTGSSPAARAATSTGCGRTPTSRRSSEDEALLLADAQTSGGLLLAGEIPGAPVIGEFVPRGRSASSSSAEFAPLRRTPAAGIRSLHACCFRLRRLPRRTRSPRWRSATGPSPEVPDGWTTVQVKAVSLNHHDLFSLRGIGLPAERMPMILGTDAAGIDEDGNEVVVHGVVAQRRLDRRRDARPQALAVLRAAPGHDGRAGRRPAAEPAAQARRSCPSPRPPACPPPG